MGNIYLCENELSKITVQGRLCVVLSYAPFHMVIYRGAACQLFAGHGWIAYWGGSAWGNMLDIFWWSGRVRRMGEKKWHWRMAIASIVGRLGSLITHYSYAYSKCYLLNVNNEAKIITANLAEYPKFENHWIWFSILISVVVERTVSLKGIMNIHRAYAELGERFIWYIIIMVWGFHYFN